MSMCGKQKMKLYKLKENVKNNWNFWKIERSKKKEREKDDKFCKYLFNMFKIVRKKKWSNISRWLKFILTIQKLITHKNDERKIFENYNAWKLLIAARRKVS